MVTPGYLVLVGDRIIAWFIDDIDAIAYATKEYGENDYIVAPFDLPMPPFVPSNSLDELSKKAIDRCRQSLKS